MKNYKEWEFYKAGYDRLHESPIRDIRTLEWWMKKMDRAWKRFLRNPGS